MYILGLWLHEFCLGGANGCWVNIFDIFAASMAWRDFIQTSVTSSGFHFLQTSFIIYNNLFRQGIWKSLWHFWVILVLHGCCCKKIHEYSLEKTYAGPLWRPLKLCSQTDGEQMVWSSNFDDFNKRVTELQDQVWEWIHYFWKIWRLRLFTEALTKWRSFLKWFWSHHFCKNWWRWSWS